MKALNTSVICGVIGAGAMGAGIAQVAAQAGHSVLLYDNREGAASTAIETIERQLTRLVEKGKFTAEQVAGIIGRLQPADSLSDFAGAGFVLEAIVENPDVKRGLLEQLESICSADCILATNTSSLSVTSLGAGRQHPQRIVGMHFFNPAPVMKLVEVVSGLETDKAIAECVFATAKAWGKEPVYARSTPGFIVNRVARPFYAESLRLLQEQAADCATLDAIMREAGGFRMGAFELTDMIGHDVNYAVTKSVFDGYYGDFRFQPSLIQKELVDAGLLGRKSGRGFYSYSENAAKPEAGSVSVSGDPVPGCTALGDCGVLSSLVSRLAAAGVMVTAESSSDAGVLRIGSATVALSDGRMACQRAREDGLSNLVLIDLALDYSKSSRLAVSRAASTSDEALQQVADCLGKADIRISEVSDVPGLVVMRTVAMLANEGADTVLHGVASAADVDTAMRSGVNYPRGPLAWADQLGLSATLTVLENLQQAYGEERYRPSLLLRRLAQQGGSFHG
ncbi:MAG: 3-hydroxyacyl-CoA dehydrogenase PaaC [Oceanospirillaceae bacterium]|nr:3-hydroxyacyl-CoA dehydrogenase PaaC [Oceanospirillaceae bacterium]